MECLTNGNGEHGLHGGPAPFINQINSNLSLRPRDL